jgi:hypothetical protein
MPLKSCSNAEVKAAVVKAMRAARVMYHPDRVQQQLRVASAAADSPQAAGT